MKKAFKFVFGSVLVAFMVLFISGCTASLKATDFETTGTIYNPVIVKGGDTNETL